MLFVYRLRRGPGGWTCVVALQKSALDVTNRSFSEERVFLRLGELLDRYKEVRVNNSDAPSSLFEDDAEDCETPTVLKTHRPPSRVCSLCPTRVVFAERERERARVGFFACNLFHRHPAARGVSLRTWSASRSSAAGWEVSELPWRGRFCSSRIWSRERPRAR